MKHLLVAPLPDEPRADYVSEFPEDVAKLVAVASQAGYVVSPQTAAELWVLYSQGLCASWLSMVEWDDNDVLRDMLRFAVVVEHAEVTPLPDGYLFWLDYVVETADAPYAHGGVRCTNEERGAASRAVRDAARAELAVLRRLAGTRRSY